jgi:two-component system, chemotaxis family, protein-glutamate methylesterase/glutaminase
MPSFYTCPECHGSMVSISEGPLRRYRCHTGHGFTQGALRQEGMTQIERTLWSALAQIEEQKLLQLELADQAATAGRPELHAQFRERASRIDAFAERTRTLALDALLCDPIA